MLIFSKAELFLCFTRDDLFILSGDVYNKVGIAVDFVYLVFKLLFIP